MILLLVILVFLHVVPRAFFRADGRPRTLSKEDSFRISFDNYHKVIICD